MRFLYPLGLLGLIGIPILLVIYILRSKYNEQTVASTYLWTLSEKFFKRRNPLSGITGIISLILQILMVIILSLAISRPIFTVPESASEYCFVLDASGSMNIKSGLKTRFEKGKDYIEDTINSARLGSSYTLVCVSDKGSVIYERVTEKKLAISMLNDLSCTDIPSGNDDGLELAQKYFSENTKGVIRIGLHFITPYSSRDNDMNDVTFFESSQKDILKRLARDVSRHKPKTTTPNFLASWVLPDENKYFEVSYKGTYPGLLLLGKIYSSIAHEGCVKVND